MKAPTVLRLDDAKAEQVRAEHHRALTELQATALAAAKVITGVSIADSTTVYVPHGLGRVPRMMLTSPVRGASSSGRLIEATGVTYDRSKYVALYAAGWGATITVDVVVF